MLFSEFLNSKRAECKALITALSDRFEYVSILGSDVKSTAVSVNRRSSNIGEGNLSECGFVIKMHDGRAFFEYSLESFSQNGFVLSEISLDLHNSDFEGNIVTEYEQKFVSQGLPIYRLVAKMK